MSKFLLLEGKLLGGKADQLIKLHEAGFKVPDFKVIPAEYQEQSDQFAPEVEKQFSKTDTLYSVRSSAIGEDGQHHSFAGLFESYLYVRPDQILEKIQDVFDSTKAERVSFYLKTNQIEGPLKMAVIIQKMIDPDVSGVMFGVHPVSQEPDEMLISAVYGVGEGLVSGLLDSDDYTIKEDKVIDQNIAKKTQKVCNAQQAGGTIVVDIPEKQQLIPALRDDHLERLIELLQKTNDFYNYPQDVEFAIKDDEIYILQSRPITHLSQRSGTKIIWDNSNIIESYPGVTTPLTFSFIREMYKVVYEQFSALLGIDQQVLKTNADIYENMLGLIRGRVYYNLRSWYRALALLPGYRLNAGFMETMMGVKERFDLEEEYQVSKTRARLMIVKTVFRMIRTFRKLPRDRDDFLAFLDLTVKKYQAIDFEECSPEQLMKHYNTFENILTEKWNPPLVNDFFAMIYFGVFQKLIAKWIGQDYPHLHNDLLSSSNDIISTQPMLESLRLAQKIIANDQLLKLFEDKPEIVWHNLEGNPFKKEILGYLAKFGERCLGELKLETISYNQAPEKYIKILQSYVNNPKAFDALDQSRSQQLRKDARQIVYDKLKGKWIKRRIFNYFLNKTRSLVSNRENLRFERTRGFGIVRQIFSALGVRFAEKGLIEEDRDIFYLTKEEIFDYIKGTAISTKLKEVIDLRKKEYRNYETDPYIPVRLITYGSVNEGLDFSDYKPKLVAEEGDLKGIACCPGIVRSEVCVVHSPDEIDDLGGRIMVTSSTDPGWVSLFPTAAGIIVERGSLLSHSAIVARELGIPCIVSINDLLNRVKTGDLVEMDGSTGVIKMIGNEEY